MVLLSNSQSITSRPGLCILLVPYNMYKASNTEGLYPTADKLGPYVPKFPREKDLRFFIMFLVIFVNGGLAIFHLVCVLE